MDAFFNGFIPLSRHQDTEGATEYLTTATVDPSFTIAQSPCTWCCEGRRAARSSLAPLVAAMEHLHRVPERFSFEIKAEYYVETGETDMAATVVGMWVDLYPNDLRALRILAEMQMAR